MTISACKTLRGRQSRFCGLIGKDTLSRRCRLSCCFMEISAAFPNWECRVFYYCSSNRSVHKYALTIREHYTSRFAHIYYILVTVIAGISTPCMLRKFRGISCGISIGKVAEFPPEHPLEKLRDFQWKIHTKNKIK